ncbi:uncharacterized protein SPPG_01752 [Spizellomyces punctatus DAOM BR117]|uniref:RRM domain-containing protein n=1 Tax=Spizellomyces punctatus (strain DAOM BR117) TaxID=645134 RepID=A0A0L0HNL5_SPIPD|nr:uncharacterized protein SPPG_01752 [Spizellomyces punctatus DAOM BR117]KND02667.1 hypothetical protein SPPG_01752 [Spizellomyces punctatus DAOM BR117]|eukprot:XP_016610706.1 hypothetical protein SPPG_01752 [Spizellomyces punctatus DAOM BR117]
MNVVKEIERLNAAELFRDIKDSASWHSQYKDSAYVFVGGIPYELTEGDLIAVFSQYGEIVDLNLVRDKQSGKSKGFAFVAFEDQRSTTLAVDNFNGIKILNRTIRVDHVAKYRGPKKDDDFDEEEEKKRKLHILPPHLRPKEPKPDGADSSSSESEMDEARRIAEELDKEDPMRAYLARKAAKKAKKEAKKAKKEKKKKRKERGEAESINEEQGRESRTEPERRKRHVDSDDDRPSRRDQRSTRRGVSPYERGVEQSYRDRHREGYDIHDTAQRKDFDKGRDHSKERGMKELRVERRDGRGDDLSRRRRTDDSRRERSRHYDRQYSPSRSRERSRESYRQRDGDRYSGRR